MTKENKVWDRRESKYIERPERLDNFLKDIEAVCKQHQLSISHEDLHGSFVIVNHAKKYAEWINAANIDFNPDRVVKQEDPKERRLKQLSKLSDKLLMRFFPGR